MQSSEAGAGQTEALQAAVQTMQANDAHDRAILEDFSQRVPHGFHYRYLEEHHLYEGGPKTKFRNNVAAIRLLKELEKQGRKATAEEQITLAKFVGWGGLANALTPGKSGWEMQYEEIHQLLTEEEFQAAQESTLTAYYTEQGVIRHIEAVNDYYDRCVAIGNDPYLETREKEDAFAGRIVEAVEKKVMSNLPALFGMYMAQMQFFPLSVPMGAYPATRGGMVYDRASANGTNNGNAVMGGAVSPIVSNPADMEAAMQNAGDVQEEAVPENATEPPDNDLIDFDAF